MKKPNGGMQVDLNDDEIAYLKRIHNAQALRELMTHPGWEILQEITQRMVGRLEDQHLNFAVTGSSIAGREAYWASGIRLGGARDFAKVLLEKIATEVSILTQPLVAPKKPDPADFDGDYRNGQPPEGE